GGDISGLIRSTMAGAAAGMLLLAAAACGGGGGETSPTPGGTPSPSGTASAAPAPPLPPGTETATAPGPDALAGASEVAGFPVRIPQVFATSANVLTTVDGYRSSMGRQRWAILTYGTSVDEPLPGLLVRQHNGPGALGGGEPFESGIPGVSAWKQV